MIQRMVKSKEDDFCQMGSFFSENEHEESINQPEKATLKKQGDRGRLGIMVLIIRSSKSK